MNNSQTLNDETVKKLINKIPKQMYFQQMDDKKKVTLFLEYLIRNHANEVLMVNQEKLIRALIVKQLRLVNMKIVDVNILLLSGLNELNEEMLNLNQKQIVMMLIKENMDKNDLDIMNRIVAQVRTKLPSDLNERMNFNHTQVLKNVIHKYLTKDNLLREGFSSVDIDSIDFSEIDTPEELDAFHKMLEEQKINDSTNNNEKILTDEYYIEEELINEYNKEDVKMFNMEIKKLLEESTYTEQEKKHIADLLIKQKKEELILAKDLDHINVDKIEEDKNTVYIDRSPELMIHADDDEKKYYYDKYSDSLKLLPEDSKMKPVNINQLEELLKSQNIDDEEIEKTLVYLKDNKIGENGYVLESEYGEKGDEDKGYKLIKQITIILLVSILLVIIVNLIITNRTKIMQIIKK